MGGNAPSVSSAMLRIETCVAPVRSSDSFGTVRSAPLRTRRLLSRVPPVAADVFMQRLPSWTGSAGAAASVTAAMRPLA
jgi:hypothetical protein